MADDISDLNKRATTLKRVGDLAGAVEVLRQARVSMPHSFFTVTVEDWLRLPLFLQQAGQFDEAAREFDWLLSVVDEWIAIDHPDAKVSTRDAFAHAARSTIYDKMRVAYGRQGKNAEAEEFGRLSHKHWAAHQRWLRASMKRAETN